jgi:hypothetical protein
MLMTTEVDLTKLLLTAFTHCFSVSDNYLGVIPAKAGTYSANSTVSTEDK